jgi:hypothetical protein
MDQELPQTLGYEAAGIVDEIGDSVSEVVVCDRVFGASPNGAAQAELVLLSYPAPIPDSLDYAASAALPAAVETAAGARPAGRLSGQHRTYQRCVRQRGEGCRSAGRGAWRAWSARAVQARTARCAPSAPSQWRRRRHV